MSAAVEKLISDGREALALLEATDAPGHQRAAIDWLESIAKSLREEFAKLS